MKVTIFYSTITHVRKLFSFFAFSLCCNYSAPSLYFIGLPLQHNGIICNGKNPATNASQQFIQFDELRPDSFCLPTKFERTNIPSASSMLFVLIYFLSEGYTKFFCKTTCLLRRHIFWRVFVRSSRLKLRGEMFVEVVAMMNIFVVKIMTLNHKDDKTRNNMMKTMNF